MKLIDEKGRIFGKVNIIDLCVLLAVVLAIGGFFFKNASLGKSETSYKTITYTMEIKGVREATLSTLKAIDGNEISVTKTNELLGTVTDVSYKDAEEFLIDKSGNYLKGNLPDKYDITVTVTTQGTETKKGIYTQGGKQLFIGEGINFTANNLETSGEVQTITVE